ncbi:MAG: peptidoglycan-binding protein [Stigonema ocellatum SAG 48.90 = DSM 106950]|nr:peptidoglycan-binding protein [Stigonema ocellatum SAG 48.90 = DSM 106950]
MWCGFGNKSVTVAAACLVTASLVISDTAFGVSQKNYTPQQFRAVLRGLGYKVKVSNAPLTDAETKKAILEFQKGYKLQPADGVAGKKTEDFAASIVQILQANLNLVLKLKPPITRNQYYGPKTEAAVRQYQKKNQLQETGIADLPLRQKLDQEAESNINNPASTPSKVPSTKPKASPTASPEATSTPTESPSPTESPTATPTESPQASPTATPKPTSKPRSKPTSTPKTKS